VTGLTCVVSAGERVTRGTTAESPEAQAARGGEAPTEAPETLPRANSNFDHAIVTPIINNRLAVLLRNYDDRLARFVVDGFRFGFRIPSAASPRESTYTNHPSAREHAAVVDRKLETELKLGRIQGPFDAPPPDTICSPLGVVPKKERGEFRLIHDLSFPHADSVNSNIPGELTRVEYELLDDCVAVINDLGRGALMAKVDLKDAFRLIPIAPRYRHLLGFVWRNKYYLDNCLPMGCSVSCSTFEAFTSALQWALFHEFSVPYVSHILDDFSLFSSLLRSASFNRYRRQWHG
jgi:hypothetical protein